MASPSVKPEAMGFGELMSSIDSGVLKIPEFQRDFDWDLERTLRLLDSIAKRYPVGVFLLWETSELLGSIRNVGNLALPDVPPGKDVCYVLDGQQRITSLYAAAKGAHVKGEDYNIFCDLGADLAGSEIFRAECPDPDQFVSLADILGDYPYKVTQGMTEETLSRFHAVREAFREYQFPVVRVRNQPIAAVCEMFERVNTGGMALDVFDIMVAKTWTQEFNLRDQWEDFAVELASVGFGGLSPKVILQAAAAHTRQAVSEDEILKMDRSALIPAWDHVKECFRRAIDFLRISTDLPGRRLICYPIVLVVVSHFFDKNDLKAPSKTQTSGLREYYWRVGLTERYGSNPSSTVPEDMRLMEAITRGEDVHVPARWAVRTEHVMETPLRTGSAFCRALLGVLGHSRPVDITNGNTVMLDNSFLAQANSRHYHHVFPKKWLSTQGINENVDSVANIMFVPANLNMRIGAAPPSTYLRNMADHAGESWGAWLRTHLIDKRAADALMRDDFDTFLRARARAIARQANSLMGLSREEVRQLDTSPEGEPE